MRGNLAPDCQAETDDQCLRLSDVGVSDENPEYETPNPLGQNSQITVAVEALEQSEPRELGEPCMV